jgi:hypothetical protein
VLLLLALSPQAALALAGQITHLSGAVVAQRPDGVSRILSVRSEVNEGDLLVTAANSYARVKFSDGTEVVMRPNSQLKIEAYRYEELAPERDNFLLSLVKGGMRAVTGLLARRSAAKMTVAAPNATIGIRGTHFGALFCNNDCVDIPTPTGAPPANGLHVDVADGRIVVSTQVGSTEFSVGQFGYVAAPTVLPVQVPPNQGTRVPLPPQSLNQSIQGGTVGKAQDLECRI